MEFKSITRTERWTVEGWTYKATLASRLLFSYVSPLLEVASNRTLTQDDAFEVAPNRKMDVAVPSLTDSYDHVRTKTQRQVEEKRQKMLENSQVNNKSPDLDSVKKSQTLVLLKALIRYQRPMLIFTGFMRLLNTGIQAFPAVLVARLLQSLEAGTSQPVSKSINAAYCWSVYCS